MKQTNPSNPNASEDADHGSLTGRPKIVAASVLVVAIIAVILVQGYTKMDSADRSSPNTQAMRTVSPMSDGRDRQESFDRLAKSIPAPNACAEREAVAEAVARAEFESGTSVEYARRAVISSDRSVDLIVLTGCTTTPAVIFATAFTLESNGSSLRQIGPVQHVVLRTAPTPPLQAAFIFDPGPGHVLIRVSDAIGPVVTNDLQVRPTGIEFDSTHALGP